jgi:hypothetical protein
VVGQLRREGAARRRLAYAALAACQPHTRVSTFELSTPASPTKIQCSDFWSRMFCSVASCSQSRTAAMLVDVAEQSFSGSKCSDEQTLHNAVW